MVSHQSVANLNINMKFFIEHKAFVSLCTTLPYILCGSCFVSNNRGRPESLTVVVGTVSLNQGGSSYQVSQIIVHEGYRPSNMYIHDIAILKVRIKLNVVF